MTRGAITAGRYPFAFHAAGLTPWQRDRFAYVAARNRTDPRHAEKLADHIRRERYSAD